MFNWLAQQSTGTVLALAAILGGALTLIVGIVSLAWARVRITAARTQAAVTQLMLERGMSAEDIVRVLQTEQPPEAEPAPPQIGQLMAENEYEAADISKVVRVWERLPPSVQATIRAMVEQGYEGTDLVQVLDACPARAPSLPEGERQATVPETAVVKG
jgi:hypothetical protein